MKDFKTRRLISYLCASGLLSLSGEALASAFQIWEQDGASIANYHAGYAAEAADASTAFYNPAGITRFKNQQLVVAGSAITPSVKYQGTISVSTLAAGEPMTVTSQGGRFAFVPAFHYVAPITDYLGFGFSVDVPFGAELNYGHNTVLRYAATESGIKVIDISPSLGLQVTQKASIGLGVDVQKMSGEFDQVGTMSDETLDSDGITNADDTAYGYHAGILYEFSPDTRAGLSYHSKVKHHLSGTASFSGPLADFFDNPQLMSHDLLNITLPAYTALSAYHRTQQFAFMGSIIYTQWNVMKYFVLQNVAGLAAGTLEPSTNIIVTIPQHFQNTWNISVGADYFVTDQITLKAGLGYDQSPVQNAYRTVSLPDNDTSLMEGEKIVVPTHLRG